MKILDYLMYTIITILVIMSLLAIIALHMDYLNPQKFYFNFTPEGISEYLSGFDKYSPLLAGTVATSALYFGILRLRAAEIANIEKSKQDRFSEWKTSLQFRTTEVEKNNRVMIRNINEKRLQIFKSLYPLKFNIKDKESLVSIFDIHFADKITFFEEQNTKHIGMGGTYLNDKQSYSYSTFEFIFFGMIENWYDELATDLKALYINKLPNDRTINPTLYKSAQMNYHSYQE